MRLIRPAVVTAALVVFAAYANAGQHGKPTTTPVHPATASNSTASTHTTTTTSTSTTTNTSVAQRIAAKPQLASRLQPLLPAGSTLQSAASGFRNQGQFIAALHVSQNLGIPFDQLKTQMVTDGLSLGQAIQKLRPSSNSKTAVTEAETETQEDLKTTSTTTDTTTSPTKTTSKHGSR